MLTIIRRQVALVAFILVAFAVVTAFGQPTVAMAQEGMTITSPHFVDGGFIPVQFTCDGENIPPDIQWSGVPASAQSIVLIMDDPDAVGGTWVHWVLYDIRPDAYGDWREISSIGVNSLGMIDYDGPCPPLDHGPHRYFFKLYALDIPELGLGMGASKEQVEAAMMGHVIESAQLVGRYSALPDTSVAPGDVYVPSSAPVAPQQETVDWQQKLLMFKGN